MASPTARVATETTAGIFLIVLALAVAQNAQRGTLRPWLAAKLLNRPGGTPAGAGPTPEGSSGPPPGGNGRLPDSALAPIGEGNHRLRPTAAAAYIAMRNAAAAAGVNLAVTDSYRTYAGQVACRSAKGSLCARPGTSRHGLGEAIDVRSGPARQWVQTNGEAFGWSWPAWARPGGSKPEGWHFEWTG